MRRIIRNFLKFCVTAGRLPNITRLISADQWTSRRKTKPHIRHNKPEGDTEGDSNGEKRREVKNAQVQFGLHRNGRRNVLQRDTLYFGYILTFKLVK